MLGSFSAALVLGTPGALLRHHHGDLPVRTQYPPRLPLAAALGVSLFAVMFAMLYLYRRVTANRSFVTISGKAFRPRTMDMGWLRWVLFAICRGLCVPLGGAADRHAGLCVVPEAGGGLSEAGNFTLDNYRTAFSLNAVRSALTNSLVLGMLTATIGVALTGMLAWIIQRSRVPGRGVLEYIVMFPQAGAAAGVRVRDDVGVAGVADSDLRHVLDPADRVS
jgi:iron(III) transport system permease protein